MRPRRPRLTLLAVLGACQAPASGSSGFSSTPEITTVPAGSTGDTARIMTGGPRGTPLADEASAAFRTRIDIDEPRLVEVVAYGPLAQPQAAVRVTAQRWIVPGRPATQGDGWVLELPGLVVDLVEPAAHQRVVRFQKTQKTFVCDGWGQPERVRLKRIACVNTVGPNDGPAVHLDPVPTKPPERKFTHLWIAKV